MTRRMALKLAHRKFKMGEENISNAFEYFNPSPSGAKVGDCVIRALCKALNKSWEDVYVELCVQGFIMHDLPNSDPIWGTYLLSQGFKRFIVPDTCPYCYTIADFAKDHPKGIYILGTGSHAVAIQDGVIYDSWNSGNEVPIFYFTREE